MANILIVKLGALGDLLLAEGALHDLRGHHPHDRLFLLTRRPFAELMARCPWVDEVLVDDNAPRWNLPRMTGLAKRLRRHGFERVYDLQHSRRSTFYRRWLLPAAKWSGGAGTGWLLPRRAATASLIERIEGQLTRAGVTTRHSLLPQPSWLAEPLTEALAARLRTPYVVMLPGASARHPHKRWPHYSALAAALESEGRHVVSVPGPDELTEIERFPGDALLDSGRPLGLGQLATVLLGAEFVVGNDSGPTHLAAHLGCRGVALFGDHGPTPRQTGILRSGFTACEASPLSSLSATTVHAAIQAGLAGSVAPAPSPPKRTSAATTHLRPPSP